MTADPVIPSSRHPVIFLIGPRATGKTTVARLLAGRLGWDWVDADAALEARWGKSVRAMFAEEQEAGFRRKEAALLEELCGLRRHVVATGGGVVLAAANRERLRAAGQVVSLTADVATLWQRLREDPGTAERRPDLTVGGLAEVEEVLRVREPLYRACAHHEVDTVGRTPDQVAAVVLACLACGPGGPGVSPTR
jgi:shikimate kinase